MSFAKTVRGGFTLIELMVVVAIIGVLMAAGIVAFSGAQKNARDAKRKADVDAIAKAVEVYYSIYQRYVDTGSWVYGGVSNNANWSNAPMVATFTSFFPSGIPPVDPTNSGNYVYYFYAQLNSIPGAANPASRFCTYARLETPNGNCSGVTNTNWGGDPNSYQCTFVTPGTGTYYCAENRQ